MLLNNTHDEQSVMIAAQCRPRFTGKKPKFGGLTQQPSSSHIEDGKYCGLGSNDAGGCPSYL